VRSVPSPSGVSIQLTKPNVWIERPTLCSTTPTPESAGFRVWIERRALQIETVAHGRESSTIHRTRSNVWIERPTIHSTTPTPESAELRVWNERRALQIEAISHTAENFTIRLTKPIVWIERRRAQIAQSVTWPAGVSIHRTKPIAWIEKPTIHRTTPTLETAGFRA